MVGGGHVGPAFSTALALALALGQQPSQLTPAAGVPVCMAGTQDSVEHCQQLCQPVGVEVQVVGISVTVTC